MSGYTEFEDMQPHEDREMSNQFVTVTAEDNDYFYRITAQATSLTTVGLTETKTAKADQKVSNATYDATDVAVVNDVLKGTIHLPGFQTESITLTRGPNNQVTLQTGGLFFGVGAQTIGPFVLNDADYAALGTWETENFPHN